MFHGISGNFQTLETVILRTARTLWYTSPGLGVLPRPTKPSSERWVSEPDYTSNNWQGVSDGNIEGTLSFEIDFAIFQ